MVIAAALTGAGDVPTYPGLWLSSKLQLVSKLRVLRAIKFSFLSLMFFLVLDYQPISNVSCLFLQVLYSSK